jgi:hypothetical protein
MRYAPVPRRGGVRCAVSEAFGLLGRDEGERSDGNWEKREKEMRKTRVDWPGLMVS